MTTAKDFWQSLLKPESQYPVIEASGVYAELITEIEQVLRILSWFSNDKKKFDPFFLVHIVDSDFAKVANCIDRSELADQLLAGDWQFFGLFLDKSWHRDLPEMLSRFRAGIYQSGWYRKPFHSEYSDYYLIPLARLIVYFFVLGHYSLSPDRLLDLFFTPENRTFFSNDSDPIPFGFTIPRLLLAARIDRDDETSCLENFRKDIYENSGGLSSTHLLAIFHSERESNWKMAVDLLQAARLQEGLRSSITELCCDGRADAFRFMLHFIRRENIIRFSSTVRAFCTWTGTSFQSTRKSSIEKNFELFCELVENEEKRKKALEGNDPIALRFGLIAESLEETDHAVDILLNKMKDPKTSPFIKETGFQFLSMANAGISLEDALLILKPHSDNDHLLSYAAYEMTDHHFQMVDFSQVNPDDAPRYFHEFLAFLPFKKSGQIQNEVSSFFDLDYKISEDSLWTILFELVDCRRQADLIDELAQIIHQAPADIRYRFVLFFLYYLPEKNVQYLNCKNIHPLYRDYKITTLAELRRSWPRSIQQRETLFNLLSDRSVTVREVALCIAFSLEQTTKEWEKIDALASVKSLRGTLIKLILDSPLKSEIVARLRSSGNINRISLADEVVSATPVISDENGDSTSNTTTNADIQYNNHDINNHNVNGSDVIDQNISDPNENDHNVKCHNANGNNAKDQKVRDIDLNDHNNVLHNDAALRKNKDISQKNKIVKSRQDRANVVMTQNDKIDKSLKNDSIKNVSWREIVKILPKKSPDCFPKKLLERNANRLWRILLLIDAEVKNRELIPYEYFPYSNVDMIEIRTIREAYGGNNAQEASAFELNTDVRRNGNFCVPFTDVCNKIFLENRVTPDEMFAALILLIREYDNNEYRQEMMEIFYGVKTEREAQRPIYPQFLLELLWEKVVAKNSQGRNLLRKILLSICLDLPEHFWTYDQINFFKHWQLWANLASRLEPDEEMFAARCFITEKIMLAQKRTINEIKERTKEKNSPNSNSDSISDFEYLLSLLSPSLKDLAFVRPQDIIFAYDKKIIDRKILWKFLEEQLPEKSKGMGMRLQVGGNRGLKFWRELFKLSNNITSETSRQSTSETSEKTTNVLPEIKNHHDGIMDHHDGIMDNHDGINDLSNSSVLSSSRPPIIDEYINEFLEKEFHRGALPVPGEEILSCLNRLEGADYFVRILHAFGKDKFQRNFIGSCYTDKKSVLSDLLRKTAPAPNDSALTFLKMIDKYFLTEKNGKKSNIMPIENEIEIENENNNEKEVCKSKIRSRIPDKIKDRIIEGAIYSPRWLAIVEEAFDIPGLKSAACWFKAHAADQWNKGLDIMHYSQINAGDFTDGAIDEKWFWSAYQEVGQEMFDKIYVASKYVTDGAKHVRARIFADVLLGKISRQQIENEIKTKRDRNYLLVYPLLPGNDNLIRYKYLREFEKESAQAGSCRGPAEKRAVQIALMNLARHAGYDNIDRFFWQMEDQQMREVIPLLIPRNIKEFEVQLVIDPLGQASVKVKKEEKELKTIPAALGKDPYIVSLKQIVKELRNQRIRARKMLENAMITGASFTENELKIFRTSPVLGPMVRNLLWIHEGKIDFFDEFKINELTAIGEKCEKQQTECKTKELTSGEVIMQRGLPGEKESDIRYVIAHPLDLLKSKKWARYQKTVLEKGIVQPFKQIFRELYVKTAEEKKSGNTSNRYSGFQIQTARFYSLLKSRDWGLSSDRVIERIFYEDNLRVEMEGLDDFLTAAEVEPPTLESIKFYNRLSGTPIEIEKIPDRIFSEVMRDLDLAVSVAHAGAIDPEASHSTVEMRLAIVTALLPFMKLKNVELKENHAMIHGKFGEYSVHLGSGICHKTTHGMLDILPVPSQSRGRIFLPFMDDDPKTAEVITKILFLAEDEKIKDPNILEQIR